MYFCSLYHSVQNFATSTILCEIPWDTSLIYFLLNAHALRHVEEYIPCVKVQGQLNILSPPPPFKQCWGQAFATQFYVSTLCKGSGECCCMKVSQQFRTVLQVFCNRTPEGFVQCPIGLSLTKKVNEMLGSTFDHVKQAYSVTFSYIQVKKLNV